MNKFGKIMYFTGLSIFGFAVALGLLDIGRDAVLLVLVGKYELAIVPVIIIGSVLTVIGYVLWIVGPKKQPHR